MMYVFGARLISQIGCKESLRAVGSPFESWQATERVSPETVHKVSQVGLNKRASNCKLLFWNGLGRLPNWQSTWLKWAKWTKCTNWT